LGSNGVVDRYDRTAPPSVPSHDENNETVAINRILPEKRSTSGRVVLRVIQRLSSPLKRILTVHFI
jgi:hypothetical protein